MEDGPLQSFLPRTGPDAAKLVEGAKIAREKLQAFVSNLSSNGQLHPKIVCITSGGTTVPLERRCVRFIDNFSAGTRGAKSAERFLQADYGVVFLNRRGSMQPFTVGLGASSGMDFICDSLAVGSDGSVKAVSGEAGDLLHSTVKHLQEVKASGRLLNVEFTTVFEYLSLLEVIARTLEPLGAYAMMYMAAAVSDFYIPWDQMEEHKIQSADGGMKLELAPVPKMLGVLRGKWAPQAFVVSFKLETDERILESKAKGALHKYGVHLVVANQLATRKTLVQLFWDGGSELLQKDPSADDIEQHIVERLVELHKNYIRKACD